MTVSQAAYKTAWFKFGLLLWVIPSLTISQSANEYVWYG